MISWSRALFLAFFVFYGFLLGYLNSLNFSSRFMPSPKPRVSPAQPNIIHTKGTTVPTKLGSNYATKKSEPKKCEPIAQVDPSDPYSFGFVHVGKVAGAHGVKGEVKVVLTEDVDGTIVSKGATVFVRKPNRKTPRPVRVVTCRRQGLADDTAPTLLLQLEGVTTRTLAEQFRHYDVYGRKSGRDHLLENEYLVRDLVGLRCYHVNDRQAVEHSRTATTLENSASKESTVAPPSPIARIVGVVPPDELCDSPVAAKLMHAQLELEILAGSRYGYQHAVPSTESMATKSASSGQQAVTPGRQRRATGQDIGPSASHKRAQLCLVPMVPSIVVIVDLARRCVFLDPPAGLLELTYQLQVKPRAVKGFLPERIGTLSELERQYLQDRSVDVDPTPHDIY